MFFTLNISAIKFTGGLLSTGVYYSGQNICCQAPRYDILQYQDILTMNRILSSIFPSLSKPGREDKSPVRLLNSLLLHFRPRAVDERTLRFTLTWGLGGMAATLVVLLWHRHPA